MKKALKQLWAILLAVFMTAAMLPAMGSVSFANGVVIETVRAAIKELDADPTSYQASDKAAIEALQADFDSLSAEDQATLDAECTHPGTGQSLGRVLESALWAVHSFGIDTKTTLSDATYTTTTEPAVSSVSSKGKSDSSRTRNWWVESVVVENGQATANIYVTSGAATASKLTSYPSVWAGGETINRTADNTYPIPVDLNGTTYFGGISSSMPTPIMYSLNATIEEPAASHTHSFTYTAETFDPQTANTATITATCTANCPDGYDQNGIKLKFVLPRIDECHNEGPTVEPCGYWTYDGVPRVCTLEGYPDPAPAGLAPLPTIYYDGMTEPYWDASNSYKERDRSASITWGTAKVTLYVRVDKANVTLEPKTQTVELNGTVSSTANDVQAKRGGGTIFENDKFTGIRIEGDTSAVTNNGTLQIFSGSVGIVHKKNGADASGNYNITYETHPGTLIVTATTPVLADGTLSAGAITYGQTLEKSAISGTMKDKNKDTIEVAGTFTWKTPSTMPGVADSDSTEYEWTFTPDNTTNYNNATGKLKVKVNPSTTAIAITSADHSWTYDSTNHTDETYTVTYGGENIAADASGKVFTLPTGDKVTITPTAAGVTDCADSAANNNTFTYVLDHSDYYNNVSTTFGTLAVNKADNPTTVTDTAAVIMGGNTVDLADNVKLNGATGDVGYAIDGEANGCSLNGSVLTSGSNTGSVTVNVTVAADGNYHALAATPIAVTITDKNIQTILAADVTATYGDTDKKVTATTDGNGAISYAVKAGSDDYIDVDASTGALAIKKVPAGGKAYVVVTAAETSTYAQVTKEVTVTINKANAVAATVTANNRIYDGTLKPLVTVSGEPTGGTMAYGVSRTEETPGIYTEEIPQGFEAGTYYVWYKVWGNDNYNATEPVRVTVEIAKKDVTVTAADQEVDLNGTIDTSVSKAALSGALEGHVLGSVTLTGSSTAEATTSGTITPSAATIMAGEKNVTANYNITYVNGKLTVKKGPEDGVVAFVTRCYRIILGREAEQAGLDAWSNLQDSKQATAAQIINGFVYSPEFLAKNHSYTNTVKILFLMMLDHEADPAGLAAWTDVLEQGYPFGTVINGLCDTPEFIGICNRFGIEPGSVQVGSVQPDNMKKIKEFVSRCYRIILGRSADSAGLNAWAEALASGRAKAAEIIRGFVYSPEFLSKGYSHTQFVSILYRAMLGREPDSAGLAAWTEILDQGYPLSVIINGFCGSDEFTALCSQYGITPGSVDVNMLSTEWEEEYEEPDDLRQAIEEEPVEFIEEEPEETGEPEDPPTPGEELPEEETEEPEEPEVPEEPEEPSEPEEPADPEEDEIPEEPAEPGEELPEEVEEELPEESGLTAE